MNTNSGSDGVQMKQSGFGRNLHRVDSQVAMEFSEEEFSQLKRSFTKFDIDGDGHIDASELAVVMEMIGEPCGPNELRTLLQEADTDGDGVVSFEEFMVLVLATKNNKKESKLINAIKLASSRQMPSKYARLQNTRMVLGTNEELTGGKPEEKEDASVQLGVNASWAANIVLLILKIFAYAVSGSEAVLAALADSVVDLISQIILASADDLAKKPSYDFPVGRARIECLSVMCCAAIMIVASVEVIEAACDDLAAGAKDDMKGYLVYLLMAIGILVKLALYIYCTICNKTPDGKIKSDMLSALAEDHLNDVLSNTSAVFCLAIAVGTPAWWCDPVGAILISAVIVYRWFDILKDQTDKILGLSADDEYIEELNKIAQAHNPQVQGVTRTIAYFFGTKFNVEMDILLPATMPLEEAHDIGVSLQQEIERLDDVARAVVHVDVKKRDMLHHIPDREREQQLLLLNNGKNPVTLKRNGRDEDTYNALHNV